MNNFYNIEKVKETLKIVLPLIKENTRKYWFMGSMATAALNDELYRDIHDFDIIITTDNLPKLLNKLFKAGYVKKPLNFFRVSELLGVFLFTHNKLLDIGFFVINTEDKYYSIKSGFAKVIIPLNNLKPYKYKFNNFEFDGVLPSFIYRLSLLHKNNPKRQKEFPIFEKHKIIPAKWPIYDIYFFGIKTNWIIDGLNKLLVIIGMIRTKLGLLYDPWL